MRGRSLALARAAEVWSALVCLYLALSLPIEVQYAALLVHWYGSSLLSGILAWRLGRPSPATVGAATLLALYTFVRILMVLPRIAEIGAAYASAARALSLFIFSSVAVAQLVVLFVLWRGGWLRREPLEGKSEPSAP